MTTPADNSGPPAVDEKVAPKPATTPQMIPITSYEAAVEAIAKELPIVTADSTKSLLTSLSTFFTTRIESTKSKETMRDDHSRDSRVRDAVARGRGAFMRRSIPGSEVVPRNSEDKKYL